MTNIFVRINSSKVINQTNVNSYNCSYIVIVFVKYSNYTSVSSADHGVQVCQRFS
jgi:hypothetical protein